MVWLLDSIEMHSAPSVTQTNFDFLIICDRKLYPTILKQLERKSYRFGIKYLIVEDSLNAMRASMQKLRVFEYPFLNSYEHILYLDSDILTTLDLDDFMKHLKISPELLYVFKEKHELKEHKNMFWSLGAYTEKDMATFKEHQIYPFNAGCFVFTNSVPMKSHFQALLDWIRDYKGPFFYEQSFMNVYFNTRRLINYDVITPDNYVMFPVAGQQYEDKIIHFCGYPGNGDLKIKSMKGAFDKMMAGRKNAPTTTPPPAPRRRVNYIL